ncbi:hypothetical protein V8C42DRAFT_305418 [Trichoderma barbatum]
MTSLLSRFLHGSPGNVGSAAFGTKTIGYDLTNSPQTLCIRSSKANASLVVVHYDGAPQNTPPLYTIAPHATTPGMFTFYRGPPDPTGQAGPIGHFTCGSKPSAELNMRGCAMKLKMSQLSGDVSITGTPMGKLKWKVNQLTGSSFTLCDSNGKKLAKTKREKAGLGDQKIEMLVPYDEMVVEIAVVTAYQTKAATERVISSVIEAVAEAVAGA